jgi:bla regulator protein BlaR1
MDFTHYLFDEHSLRAIGWTLAHSVWQIALVSGLLWAVLKVMSKSDSHRRYLAGLAALVLILVITCWTFINQLSHISASQPERVWASISVIPVSPELIAVSKEGQDPWSKPTAVTYWAAKVENLIPYLANLWMLGALFYLGRLAGSVYDLQKLHSKHHQTVSQMLLKKVDGLSAAMGLYQKVQVLQSTLVRTPVTYGFIKPVILLPATLVFSISPGQLEAIIAHELAHIRRNDFLINLFQSCLEIFFFFHPCFWWINQVINDERENATDDLALTTGVSSLDLAHGLAEVANYSNCPAPDMALAASTNKHKTLQRIKRILGKPTSGPKLSPIIPLTMILAFITASALVLGAQDQDTKAAAPVLLTEISAQIISDSRQLPKMTVINYGMIRRDTLPAKPLPKTPGQEDMPVLNLTAPPQLETDVPSMPEPPPVPPVPFADFDFPQIDIHGETDSLVKLAMELHALNDDKSEEGKKRRKALEAAMEKVQSEIAVLSKGFEDKMAQWQASHGDSFKKYEEEMKRWGERMKEHQKSWESTFAPKMEEFEKKMKLWEEENAPKLKEYEEKMKQWMEEKGERFQWQEGTDPIL